MRRLLGSLFFFSTILAGACGGGSGLEGKLSMASLSPQDWDRYCQWANGEFGSVGGKACPDNALVLSIQLDCSKNAVGGTSCPATVSQAEACTRTYKDNACLGLAKVMAKSECAGLMACAGLFRSSSGL